MNNYRKKLTNFAMTNYEIIFSEITRKKLKQLNKRIKEKFYAILR